MLPRLLLVAQVMTVWMMVDALRRKAGGQWYAIILLPFGEWFYFFSVKIHDPSMARLKRLFSRKARPPSLAALRHAAKETPSFQNRLRLAQSLYDHDLSAEAEALFAGLLAERADDLPALFGCGLCRAALGDEAGAIHCLEALVEAQPGYADYAAWLELADLRWKTGAREEALLEFAELVKVSPRAQNRVTQAHYLIEAGRQADARRVLEETVEAHRHAQSFVRKRDKRWAAQAEQMLIRLQ